MQRWHAVTPPRPSHKARGQRSSGSLDRSPSVHAAHATSAAGSHGQILASSDGAVPIYVRTPSPARTPTFSSATPSRSRSGSTVRQLEPLDELRPTVRPSGTTNHHSLSTPEEEGVPVTMRQRAVDEEAKEGTSMQPSIAKTPKLTGFDSLQMSPMTSPEVSSTPLKSKPAESDQTVSRNRETDPDTESYGNRADIPRPFETARLLNLSLDESHMIEPNASILTQRSLAESFYTAQSISSDYDQVDVSIDGAISPTPSNKAHGQSELDIELVNGTGVEMEQEAAPPPEATGLVEVEVSSADSSQQEPAIAEVSEPSAYALNSLGPNSSDAVFEPVIDRKAETTDVLHQQQKSATAPSNELEAEDEGVGELSSKPISEEAKTPVATPLKKTHPRTHVPSVEETSPGSSSVHWVVTIATAVVLATGWFYLRARSKRS